MKNNMFPSPKNSTVLQYYMVKAPKSIDHILLNGFRKSPKVDINERGDYIAAVAIPVDQSVRGLYFYIDGMWICHVKYENNKKGRRGLNKVLEQYKAKIIHHDDIEDELFIAEL